MDKLMTAALAIVLAAPLAAQTPPQTPPKPTAPPAQTQPQTPPQTAKPATPQPAVPQPAAAQPARATAMLFITNPAGQPIPDVQVTLSGPADRSIVTARDGIARIANLRAGTYRARFEAPDYIVFEKEVVLRAGQPWEIEVTLNRATTRKAEGPPVQGPLPAQTPPSAQKAAAPAIEPAGEPTMLSLPDWLDGNLIGRNDPQKDSPVGRAPGASATVLQIRENIADRVHPDADELLYVIAGEGTVRIGDRPQAVGAGWFVAIPRGTSFSLERRGRNPLILLSIMTPARGTPAGSR